MSRMVLRHRRDALAEVLGLVVTVAVVTAGLVGFTAPASAAPRGDALTCGVTITKSVVLHRDLTGCPSNGIVIGADNITLDLNDHTISGDGAFTGNCPQGTACDRGVDNSQGHTGVTVKNGSVTGFVVGLRIEGADENTVRNLSVVDNAVSGILVLDSSRIELEGNRVLRNGIGYDGLGLGLVASQRSRVERNIVDGNPAGLQVIFGSNENVVTNNTVRDNPDSGISIDGSDNRVDTNVMSKNGAGMIVAGDRNLVSRNRVSGAVGCADDACSYYGISFEHGVGNRITRNLVSRVQVGIRVDAFDLPATDTLIDRNVVRSAVKDGITVNLEPTGQVVSGTYLYRNLVIGSADDGIDVESSATTLARNITIRNADLGIEAVAGVTDGGHNHAVGNGNPAQCTGVVCTP